MFSQNIEFKEVITQLEKENEDIKVKFALLSIELNRRCFTNKAVLKRLSAAETAIRDFDEERLHIVQTTKDETKRIVTEKLNHELKNVEATYSSELERLNIRLRQVQEQLSEKDRALDSIRSQNKKLQEANITGQNQQADLMRRLQEIEHKMSRELEIARSEYSK